MTSQRPSATHPPFLSSTFQLPPWTLRALPSPVKADKPCFRPSDLDFSYGNCLILGAGQIVIFFLISYIRAVTCTFQASTGGDRVATVISSLQKQDTHPHGAGEFCWEGSEDPGRFVPVQLQLVGGHVGYGLGISSGAREGTVDALVQRRQLVKHPVHHSFSVGRESNIQAGLTKEQRCSTLAMLGLRQKKQKGIVSAK